jgi:diguanylate cyclase (GGDEF)-like protein
LWPLWSHRTRVIGYVLAVEVVAASLVVLVLVRIPVLGLDFPPFVVLFALSIGYGEATRRLERLHRKESLTPYIDFNSVWTFAGALLLHPAMAALLVIACYLHTWLRVAYRPAHRILFSAAAATCSLMAASGVLALAGYVRAFGDLPHDVVGMAVIVAAAAVKFLIGLGLVSAVIVLSTPRSSLRAVVGRWSDNRLEVATLALGALLAWALVDWPVMAVLIVCVGLVLHGSVLIGQLRKAASTDAKTGLLNTAAWYEASRREIGRASRRGTSVGVLIVDLDHFKRVNDVHGHLAGDEVLVAVAGAIGRQVRERDVVGRFGGEEFVVLLPGADGAEVVGVAERVRAGISGLTLRVTGLHGAVPLSGLTASVGVAAFPWHGDGVEALLRAADAALFAAKSGGRDQVRLAAPVTTGSARTLG